MQLQQNQKHIQTIQQTILNSAINFVNIIKANSLNKVNLSSKTNKKYPHHSLLPIQQIKQQNHPQIFEYPNTPIIDDTNRTKKRAKKKFQKHKINYKQSQSLKQQTNSSLPTKVNVSLLLRPHLLINDSFLNSPTNSMQTPTIYNNLSQHYYRPSIPTLKSLSTDGQDYQKISPRLWNKNPQQKKTKKIPTSPQTNSTPKQKTRQSWILNNINIIGNKYLQQIYHLNDHL